MQQNTDISQTFEHFRVTQIAEGLYAAIEDAKGAAHSNAGIVDLGDAALVFDTFETSNAATELKLAAELITGHAVAYVINSHSDADHWLGNQVFDDTTLIITTEESRQHMVVFTKEILHLKENPQQLNEMIHIHEEQLRITVDKKRQVLIRDALRKWHNRAEALPNIKLRYANQTFQRKLTFHGALRTAVIHSYGMGHSASDCFLYLPREKVGFMGDLVFCQHHPSGVHGDHQLWQNQLEKISQLDIEIFVPGHGSIGTKEDLRLQIEYMTILDKLITQAIKNGASLEDLATLAIPPQYVTWSNPLSPAGKTFFETNVQLAYQRIKNRSA